MKQLFTTAIMILTNSIVFSQTESGYSENNGEYYVIGEESMKLGNWIEWNDEKSKPYYTEGFLDENDIIDEVSLLEAKNMGEIQTAVRVIMNKKDTLIIDRLKYPHYFVFVSIIESGTYKTACGKGYWDCEDGEKSEFTIKNQGIWFGPFEKGGARTFVWNSSKEKFEDYIMND